MMNPSDARQVLAVCAVTRDSDFHKLDSATVETLLIAADSCKYRKPKNANGSRARYFHAYLCRQANKEE